MIPVAIIDWDGTRPGTRLANFAAFLWAFLHPAVYGEGEPAACMLRAAAAAYGWSGDGLVDSMLAAVRSFQTVVDGDAGQWSGERLSSPTWRATRMRSGSSCPDPPPDEAVRRSQTSPGWRPRSRSGGCSCEVER
jgi:hypothetical protein